jgi:hypothetical protein
MPGVVLQEVSPGRAEPILLQESLTAELVELGNGREDRVARGQAGENGVSEGPGGRGPLS